MRNDHTIRADLIWQFGLDHVPDAAQIPAFQRDFRPMIFAFHSQGLVVLDGHSRRLVLVRDHRTYSWFSQARGVTALCNLGAESFAVVKGSDVLILDPTGAVTSSFPINRRADFIAPARNGRFFIVQTSAGVVFEVAQDGCVTWTPPAGLVLREPRSAELLPDASGCLIVDDRANSVILCRFADNSFETVFGGPIRQRQNPDDLYSPKHASPSAHGMLIADSYNCRILEVELRTRRVLRRFGSCLRGGSGPGQTWRPVFVREDVHGRVIFLDKKNGRIDMLHRDGTRSVVFGQATVASAQFRLPRSIQPLPGICNFLISDTHGNGVSILSQGQLRSHPVGQRHDLFWPRCAVAKGTNLYISDSRNDRIVICPLLLKAFAQDRVVRWDGLDDPHEISPCSDGSWLVVNTNADRIDHVDLTSGVAQPVKIDTELSDPHSVAQLPDGRIAIADTGNDRVVIRSPDGRCHTISEVSFGGEATLRLKGPRHVSVFDPDHLVVTDTGSRGVVVLRTCGVGVFHIAGTNCLETGRRFLYQDGYSFLYDPRWALLSQDGRMLLGDTGNNRILMVQVPMGALPRPNPENARISHA